MKHGKPRAQDAHQFGEKQKTRAALLLIRVVRHIFLSVTQEEPRGAVLPRGGLMRIFFHNIEKLSPAV